MKAILFIPLLLTGCTVGPVITDKAVSLGGTIFTKSENYYARYEGPLGKLEYGSSKSDETVVAGKALNAYTGIALAREYTASQKVTEGTTKALAKEETSRAATRSAADVEKLRIVTPPHIPPP